MKTWIGTRETREARELAQSAEADDRDHRRNCIDCTRATRQRREDARCQRGRELLKARREADAHLAEQRRLDKLPAPGQQPLFELDEIPGA